jgi:hypothetical protein
MLRGKQMGDCRVNSTGFDVSNNHTNFVYKVRKRPFYHGINPSTSLLESKVKLSLYLTKHAMKMSSA